MRVGLAILLASLSFSSYAGIKDNKAKKEVAETLKSAVANVKSACGNASLAGDIDWANWDTYDYTKLSGNKAKSEVILSTKFLVEALADDIAELCKDADYKAELAKLTKLNFSGKKDQSSMYVDFKLNGTTLNMQLNADAIGSWKNKDLLKKVWE